MMIISPLTGCGLSVTTHLSTSYWIKSQGGIHPYIACFWQVDQVEVFPLYV